MTAALLSHWTAGPAEGVPLVLLHPIAASSAVWGMAASVWARRYRVIAIDLPGHGHSRGVEAGASVEGWAGAVAALLAHLQVRGAAVVGLSLGGMVAQALALDHPERVAALVLAHTTAQTTEAARQAWQQRLQAVDREGMAGQVVPTLSRWFTPDFLAASPATTGWVGAAIGATDEHGYRQAIQAIQRLDLLGRLAGLRVPTLVLAGQADTAVPPTVSQALAACIPGAQFSVLPDAAHLGVVQQPVAFTEAVARFLALTFPSQETV